VRSREAFQEYLAIVPHGLHGAEARDRLAALAQSRKEQDDSDWRATLHAGTAAAYQHYLSDHPDGRHAAEARYGLAWDRRRRRSRAVGQIVARASKALESGQIEESASLLRKALEDGDNRRYPELWNLWARTVSQGRPRAIEKVYPGRVLAGHSGRVRAVRLTVDGERAVSVGWDKRLLVWDLRTRSCLASLEGHASGVSCVAVHPDGRRAISGGRDATLCVWDLDAGECLEQLSGHLDSVNGVEISADGRWAASAGSDATVRVWDLETGHARQPLTGHMGEVLDLVVDSGDERIVSVGQDGTVRVWDLLSQTCVSSLRGGDEPLNSVDLSPDGRLAATAGNDRTIRLWELSSSQCVAVLKGHQRPVVRVRFTVEGTRLLSTGRDKSLRIWDVESGELLRTFEGHGDQVTDVAAGGGDRWAITSSHDHTLRLWDLESGRSVAVLGPSPGRTSVMAVADDETILLAGDDRRIRCVDALARRGIGEWGGHLAAVASLQVSPDGRRALSIDADQRLQLRDCHSGQSLPTPKRCPLPPLSAGFSADGQSLLAVCVDGSVCRYDPHAGTWAKAGSSLDARLTCASILAGADLVGGGTEQGDVLVWHPTTSKIVARVSVDSAPVTGVALPGGGQRGVAIAGKKLHFVDLSNSQVVSAPAGRWRSVAISSDGNWAASGGADGELAVWDARNATCLTRLPGHEGPVLAVGFSPSGSLLVSGGADARLRTWRLMWDLEP
jgi:WD40 repeat protein